MRHSQPDAPASVAQPGSIRAKGRRGQGTPALLLLLACGVLAWQIVGGSSPAARTTDRALAADDRSPAVTDCEDCFRPQASESATPTETPTVTPSATPTVTPTQVNSVPNNPHSLPAGTTPEACSAFARVSDRAFGLTGAGGYGAEDAFEIEVFADQLYVGMEADNSLGARLWRTKAGEVIATAQADWEEVSSVGGVPAFGDAANNDHIDSIQSFAGHIYVSTAMRSGDPTPDGTELWRSATGAADSWTQVNANGFGDTQNVNFKDMAVIRVGVTDYLCGGTGHEGTTGTEVWCSSDGTTWTQQNTNGFGQPATALDILIGSTAVYGGRLYAGTTRFNLDTFAQVPGAVWRTVNTSVTPWTWEQVFAADTNERVDILGVYGGHVYAAFNGGGGTEIWRSATGDSGTWSQVNSDGFGNANNGRAIVDDATVYNGVLYFATLNLSTGTELFRTTDGTTWTQVGPDGLDGTASNAYTELLPLNGHLYAWVGNYSLGQAVYRSKCGICETESVTGAATYTYAGVGGVDPSLVVTAVTTGGDVELCTYPNAFPNDVTAMKPVKRHYTVDVAGGVTGLVADLKLSYFSDDVYEYVPSDITDESTTYLTRWDEANSTWNDCPGGNRTRDVGANTATCSGVTAFSPWAIAGSGGAPTAIQLIGLQATAGRLSTAALGLLALAACALVLQAAAWRRRTR